MAALDQAQAMADARFNPQQAAIDARIKLINDTTNVRNNSMNVFGEQGRANIGGAYDTLQGLLGANKQNAMGALTTAGNQVGQGYRDAQQIGTSLRDTSRNTMAELARSMNAGNYAMPVIGGLESEANQLIANNANRDATVTGNLRNWAAQSGDIYSQQEGTGHMMRADALSRLESDLLRAIQENNLSGAEQTSDMNDRLAEMLGERGAYLAEQVNQLSAQEFEQAFKQAQLDQQAAEASDRHSATQAELSLRAQGMADERDARAQAGEMTEKEKLAMQMQAWGMAQDQSNTDRDFGLRQSEFLQGNKIDPMQLTSFLSENMQRDALGNISGGVNPAILELLYQQGVMDRPPNQGTSVGGAGPLSSLPSSGGWNRQSAAKSLSQAYGQKFGGGGKASSIGGYSALPIYPTVGTSMRFGS